MATQEQIPTGKYCFSIAEKAIRYTNDERAWTPNNIRRLIISPNMIVTQLHIGGSKQQIFDQKKYAECYKSDKYVSMTSVLGGRSGTNICSHIEEIVYCLRGVNGENLRNEESDWRTIVRADKASNTEEALKNAIGARFKRLRGIVLYSGSITEFMGEYKAKLSAEDFQICDDAHSGKLTCIHIHTTDWYKGYYFRPAHYQADAESGKLYHKLHSLESKMEEKFKLDKKDKSRTSAIESFRDKYKTSVDRFISVYKTYKATAIALKNPDKQSYIFKTYIKEFTLPKRNNNAEIITDYFEMIPHSLREDLTKLGVEVNQKKSECTSQSIQASIELLDSMTSDYYKSMAGNYLTSFATLTASGLKIFARTFFNQEVYIPQGEYLNSIDMKSLSEIWKDREKRVSIDKSMNTMSEVLLTISTK